MVVDMFSETIIQSAGQLRKLQIGLRVSISYFSGDPGSPSFLFSNVENSKNLSARSSVRSCRMGGAKGATHPTAVNGAFGAVSGLQNFLDFCKIEGLNFLIGNFLIAQRTVQAPAALQEV